MKREPLYTYLDHPKGAQPGAEQDELLRILQEVEQLPEAGPDDAYWQYFDTRLQRRIAGAKQAPVPFFRRFRLHLGLAVCVSALALFLLVPKAKTPSLANLSDDQLTLMADLFNELDEAGASYESAIHLDEFIELYDSDEYDIFATPQELPSAEVLEELWNSEG